jgi:hypothetical protein
MAILPSGTDRSRRLLAAGVMTRYVAFHRLTCFRLGRLTRAGLALRQVVNGMIENVQNHDFVFGRMLELATALGCE